MSGTYVAVGFTLCVVGLVLLLTVGRKQESTAGRAARFVASLFILAGFALAMLNLVMSY